MPGVSREMNGYKDFEHGHLRTSSYANGYDSHRHEDRHRWQVPPLRSTTGGMSVINQSGYYDDIRPSSSRAHSDIIHRDVGYGRSGRHNGIDPEFEQNSFEGGMRDGTERSFEVDHLATYTSKSGTTHPEDGLMKLKQMESSTGIWTMRCLLIVEGRHIIVIDKGNGDELERFPLAQVHEPTAVLKNDRRETYNNLILFTVIDDPRRKNSPSDMHIFQSVNAPAHDIVDEILAAKGEGLGRKGPYEGSIPPPPSGPAPVPPYGKSSNFRESEKLAQSHRYPGEQNLGESRRSERGFGESRREESNLGDSRISNWGVPNRLDDAQLGNSRSGDMGLRESRYQESGLRDTRLGESGLRDTGLRDTRLGESGLRDTGLRDTHLRESELRDSRSREMGLRDTNLGASELRDSHYHESGLRGSHLRETGMTESYRDENPYGISRLDDSRRNDGWMSKSLRYRETQVREPKPGASGRFNDASQWIHQSHSTSPHYRQDDVPGSVRSMQALEYPGFSELDPDFGWHTESRVFSPKKTGTNAFGTWSGRNFSSDYLETGQNPRKGKKGKKWYKFAFTKRSDQKSKGSENRGYKSDSEYMVSQVPLTRSLDEDNYASLSRRRIKSENDVKADYLLTDDSQGHHGFGATREINRASYIHREDMDTGQNEALERDVQLLNNCFDDIEKFVSRLQQAAEAYKELERRRYERGHRNKRKSAGDGMLTMRARPPPADDFIDIFQKFKFAFNLLAKLKAHIHDPNAPELIHFLFTPLSLIYDASKDPIHQGEDLPDRALSPLLVFEAKQLLLNCLTSKELELWQRLGKSWTLTKEDFKGYVQPYTPRFYNGWQPSPQVIDEINRPGPSGSAANRSFRQEEYRPPVFPEPERYPRAEPSYHHSKAIVEDPYSGRDDPYISRSAREDPYSRSQRRDDFRPPSPAVGGRYNESKRDSPPPQPKTRAEENYSFTQDLKRMGATIYEAVHERQGKNVKELTVEKGDILQVLDRSRNWWKLKNCKGDTGYAPYTILKEYQSSNEYDNGQERRSGDYSSYINGNNQVPPPAPPPMSGSSRQGTRENTQLSPNLSPRSRSSLDSDKQFNEDLHNELRQRINVKDDKSSYTAPRSPRTPPKMQNVTEHSSAEEVRGWLQVKGFSRRCMDLLNGYTGIDLFDLEKKELERLLGRDEGKHLDSLLTVQKSNCGYRTRSAAELRYILQRRKERADHTGFPEDYVGKPPSFAPDNPPDYSTDSDASSDSFGNAGKTLRHLLERQRKKIQKSQYQQYN